MKSCRMLLGLALSTSITLGANLNYYDFELPGYSSDPTRCQTEASSLSDQLSKEGPVKVVRTHCEQRWDGFPDQNLVIRYQAAQELKTLTVSDSQGGEYGTAALCEADRSAQALRFKSATGLTAFAVYCTPQNGLTIVALGSSRTRRYAFQMQFASDMFWQMVPPQIEDVAALTSQIEKAVSAEGFALSRVYLKTGYNTTPRLFIYYYAKEADWRLGSAAFPTFENQDLCLAHVDEIAALYKKAGVKPLVQFCAGEQSPIDTTATLYTLGEQEKPLLVTPLLDSTLTISHTTVRPQKYSTLSECEADRSRVETEMQEMSSWKVTGSVCTLPPEERPYLLGETWYFRTIVFFGT